MLLRVAGEHQGQRAVLTEVFFVMTVSKVLYGTLPPMGSMVLFCLLLGVFAIGAPGGPPRARGG